MNPKVRIWHLVAIVVGVVAGMWLILPSTPLPPPDFSDGGFTSVRVEFRRHGEEEPLTASSSDPAVIAELADVLKTGRSVVLCRCASLGHLEFRRPDGTSERLMIMPAHDDGAVDFRILQRGRYRVDRESFLRAIRSLGVPPTRWFRFPEG